MFVFSSRAQITEKQCFCDPLWEARDLTLISILNITLGTYNVRRLKNSNKFTGLFKISVS